MSVKNVTKLFHDANAAHGINQGFAHNVFYIE